MGLSNVDIISGLTGLEIIATGYICAFILFLKHAKTATDKKVKIKIILSGFAILGLFHAWFSVASGFLLLSFGYQPLGQIPSLLGYAWGPALAIPIWVYLVSDTIKEGRYKIHITSIVALMSISFLILVYSDPLTFTFYNPSSEGGLPDSGFEGMAYILLALMLIIIMVFVGPVYISNGLKAKDKNIKLRNFSMGIGSILASFCGIIDAGFPDIPLIIIAIIRALIFTAILLIYEGVDKGN